MKFMKTSEIDMATTKTTKIKGEKYARKKADIEIKKRETKFMWMPGSKPVIQPAMIPAKNARRINHIILRLNQQDLKGYRV